MITSIVGDFALCSYNAKPEYFAALTGDNQSRALLPSKIYTTLQRKTLVINEKQFLFYFRVPITNLKTALIIQASNKLRNSAKILNKLRNKTHTHM